MDPLRDTIERALGAQYDVMRLIGRGGMGAVYLARERLLERLVAVKVLPHESATDHGGRERFLREARTAARLSHPHIVPLHTFAEAEGTLLYVMGYVEGESLEQRLTREGPMNPVDASRIVAEIADALDHAHKLGVVHRDVKPDNILLEATTGRAVLTDFGVAKHGAGASALTHTGMIVGTPHYMSPEQASGDRDIDGRSDIYALGVIGYRMISGRLPFEGASVKDVLTQHVMRAPVPLTPADGESTALATAVMRCLEKEPKGRWPSGAALARACRPRDDQDVELPDEIAHFPSMGTKLAIAAILTNMGIGLLNAYHADWEALFMVGIIALMPLVVTALYATRAPRHGLSWRSAMKMMFWKPATWWGWWPKSLLRPGDIWPRLPWKLRFVRTAFMTAFAANIGVFSPAVATLLLWSIGDNPPFPQWLGRAVIFGGGAATILPLIVPLAVWFPFRKRMGLSERAAQRLIWEPTWNNAKFWQRPEIAPMLGAAEARGASGPQTPGDYVAALLEAAAALPEAIRPALSEVGDVARGLALGVSALDTELAELARDADPAERARLEQKLVAMGVGSAEESESRRQVRELMAGQLALFDRLDARRRQLADDRERYVALLRTMWLEMASLRAANAQDALTAPEITGRLRALREEVARQRIAHAEVERLMYGPTTPSGRAQNTAP